MREQLNCGPGADTAIVDALDIVPQDPGSLCEAVQRPPVIAAAKLSASSLKVQSRKRVTVKLACPKDVATVRGQADAQARQGHAGQREVLRGGGQVQAACA